MDSSFSSTDDEIFEVVVPRNRQFKERFNPLIEFNEEEFKLRYRFTKENFRFLVDHLNNNLKHETKRNHAMCPEIQIAITLRFYATNSFYNLISDHQNISLSSACRVIKRVSTCICNNLLAEQVKMPVPGEINERKAGFHAIAGFPGVIGAIDCTHIAIQSPGGENAELYRNRKGYFSLNVQGICNEKLQFMNIVARWRGSVHDSTIFDNSRVRAQFENGEFPNCFLLGDSGYPCRNYLLTPILATNTEAEVNYNRAHIATRNCVERAFGVLKRRFPCLKSSLRTKVETSMAIIGATVTLHNIAIGLKDEVIEDEEPDINVPEAVNAAEEMYEGAGHFAARTNLINNYYQM